MTITQLLIFYFHVSSAWIAFLAFLVVCVCSIAYLLTRRPAWDQRALASAGVSTHEYTMNTLDGETRDFEARYSAKGHGEALIIVRDITDIKRAQSDLRSSEAKLKLVADQVQAVFWTVDTSLRITMMHGAGLKRLGLQPNQLVGMALSEYFGLAETDFEPMKSIISALNGQAVSCDYSWKDIMYQTFVEPLYDDIGSVIGAIA